MYYELQMSNGEAFRVNDRAWENVLTGIIGQKDAPMFVFVDALHPQGERVRLNVAQVVAAIGPKRE